MDDDIRTGYQRIGEPPCSLHTSGSPPSRVIPWTSNLCVRRLMQDAVKNVRAQHDMPANGEIAMWDYVPESLQGSEEGADDEGNQRIQPADDRSREILEQILGNEVVRRFLSYVPDEKQQGTFVLKSIEGLNWSEVAREVGVSESTAKRHYKWVRETLQHVARLMGLERKEKR